MFKYNMTSNKLLWHMERVREWEKGNKVAPIHIDLGISRGCNIQCNYCYGATQGNLFEKGINNFLDRDSLIHFMEDAGNLGVKSIAIIGEAEPLVNPHVYEAIITGKEHGVDIALASNIILWKKSEQAIEALKRLTWLRVNISAASDKSYQQIHNSKQFAKAIENVQEIVALKKEHSLSLTIGLQMVLTPETLPEVEGLSKIGAELGVDYLVVKQCSDLPTNDLGIYKRLPEYNSPEYHDILKTAEKYSNPNYAVIVKWEQITNEGKRCYDQCLGAPFLLHAAGDGRLYSCANFYESEEHKEKFQLGDFSKERFKDFFQGEAYWQKIKGVLSIDVKNECQSNCRTNSINEFLHNYKRKPKHINFV